jgi:hypothetical protein
MPNEKEISQMSTDELRAALAEFTQSQHPAGSQVPDAPGCAGLSDASRDTAATLYGQSIMKKQAGALTQEERDFLRASVGPALRDLGY